MKGESTISSTVLVERGRNVNSPVRELADCVQVWPPVTLRTGGKCFRLAAIHEMYLHTLPFLEEALTTAVTDDRFTERSVILVDLLRDNEVEWAGMPPVQCSAMGCVDSESIKALIVALERARKKGGSLVIICNDSRVMQMFELLGLDKVFSIHASEEDFLRHHPAA